MEANQVNAKRLTDVWDRPGKGARTTTPQGRRGGEKKSQRGHKKGRGEEQAGLPTNHLKSIDEVTCVDRESERRSTRNARGVQKQKIGIRAS